MYLCTNYSAQNLDNPIISTMNFKWTELVSDFDKTYIDSQKGTYNF